MPQEHIVQQGDCISSIAAQYGFSPDTIWNESANAELKESRQEPNVLYAGDVVVIPEKRAKETSASCEKCHRFRRKGVPEKLRIRLIDDKGEPIANEPFRLEVDGRLTSGQTDGDGNLEASIAPTAREGKLLFENLDMEVPLALGHVDPLSELSGVQARLNNLGYAAGDENGENTPQTTYALSEFQREHRLEISGQPDDATIAKLKDLHGY